MAAHRHRARDRRARGVVAGNLRRPEERVVEVEADPIRRRPGPVLAKGHELRGRAQNVHRGAVEDQRLEALAVVEHGLDDAARVELALHVLRQLRLALFDDLRAVLEELGAVAEAVAARVGPVGDLDFLLDGRDGLAVGAERDVAVHGLGLRVLEDERAARARRDRAVHVDDVDGVERVAVDEHRRPRPPRRGQALESKTDRLGRAARRARELD
mmetsp:Transcript_11210/g.34470  ORF Transcript_11210/g.34470 Transcript_11210/m.34470 type:complete len:214 (+) Transcript_11210:419-1060(+)